MKGNSTKLYSGVGLMALSAIMFWLVFFRLAPWVASLLPVNDWTPVLKIMIYVLIGWGGGIGFPVAVFIIGVFIIIRG